MHSFTVHTQANSKWADEEQEWGTKRTEKLLKTKIISWEHWIQYFFHSLSITVSVTFLVHLEHLNFPYHGTETHQVPGIVQAQTKKPLPFLIETSVTSAVLITHIACQQKAELLQVFLL